MIEMGRYYDLSCPVCGVALDLGRKLSADGVRITLQGLFSERRDRQLSESEMWSAIGGFLCRHIHHPLLFTSDELSWLGEDPVTCDEYMENDYVVDHAIASAQVEPSPNVELALLCYPCNEYVLIEARRAIKSSPPQVVMLSPNKESALTNEDMWHAAEVFLLRHQGHLLDFRPIRNLPAKAVRVDPLSLCAKWPYRQLDHQVWL
jgi:hypothetical protein